MNIFTYFTLQNFRKIFSRTHQIAPFKKNSRATMPLNPPANAWLRHANTRTFSKNILNPPPPPPPPPRNEILDTPLCGMHVSQAPVACMSPR